MNMIEYIFWKFWKFRVRKENNDKNGAYLSATLLFGLFFIFFPSLFVMKKQYSHLPALPDTKLYQYLIMIPIVFLCSIPVRLLLPKKKIFALEYSNTEKRRLNFKILYFILGVLLLLILGILYLKFYKIFR